MIHVVGEDRSPRIGAHALEVDGLMARIGLQAGDGFIGERLRGRGERPVAGPEGGRGVVRHNGVERPAAWSRSAWAAARSSFPAATSASNSWSQASASTAANHRRNAANSSADNSLT